MLVVLVGVGIVGNESPLVTLDVVGLGGSWSRLHSVEVLEGPKRQLRGVILHSEDKTAYQNTISIGIVLH